MVRSIEESPGLLDRIVHGHWVGREREMAEAQALWGHVVQGEERVLLIRGEPGVGKTRFVQELAALVRQDGASVLVGACYAEGSAPYTPLAGLIRDFLDYSPQIVTNIPEGTLDSLLPILPSLSKYLNEEIPSQKFNTIAQPGQIIEGLVSFCTILSSQNPLLLFIDDVHWADSDTLRVIKSLARRIRKLPVLIVLTLREAEVDANPVLQELLVDLNHERLSLQLNLKRLTHTETHDLLAKMFDEEITPSILDGIFRQTEGNPFFIEEACKTLVEAGQLSYDDFGWHSPDITELKVPQTVRTAIKFRLQKLPQATQEALRMAAILGREFDFDVLLQAGDLDEELLIEALERAIRAQLIAEVQSIQTARSRFSFVHVLIPTTLRESIIHVRRRRLHLHAAQAIEAVHPDDYEFLAYQYNEAGGTDKARHYYLLAGNRAQRLAPGEAARFYLAALASWPETDEAGRADILARLGYCQWTTDQVQEAFRSYETAFAMFQKLGKRTESGEMQWMIGQIYWEQTDREASLRHYHQALAILEEGPETPELARAISEISRMYMLASEFAEAEAWGERALEMARRLGAEDVVAHAMVNIGTSYGNRGDFEASVDMLQSALKVGLNSGLPPAACRAYDNLADVLSSCCRYAQSREISEQLYTYATNVNARNFILKGIQRMAELDWLTGHWRSALAYRAQMTSSNISIMSLYVSLFLGKMDIELGKPEEAQHELEANLLNAQQAGQPDNLISLLGKLAQAFAAQGQNARAGELLQQMYEVIAQDPLPSVMEIMPFCFAVQWSTLGTTKNQLQSGQFGLTQLERLHAEFRTGESQAALAEARGSWSVAEKRPLDAIEQFRQAAAGWQQIDRPYDQARSLAFLGRTLKSSGDAPAAQTAYLQAYQIFTSLVVQLDPEDRTSFLNSTPVREMHQAVEALAHQRSHENSNPEFGPLTGREIEVLKLVAQGLTNAQIAEQLVLSPLTINAHLRSIYNKLDVTNRTAAARAALDSGLI